MPATRASNSSNLVLFLLVLCVAAGVRAGYLWVCADRGHHNGPVAVQDLVAFQGKPQDGAAPDALAPTTELDTLIKNVAVNSWFGSSAPLALNQERTAHVAPGYPWLVAKLESLPIDIGPTQWVVRWIQCALGTLTAVFYFLFALRAFGNRFTATAAGLGCALHPFWVFNTAEINDGVLTTFLLATCLLLGERGTRSGDGFVSLSYGLLLAALALVRAALLPLAVVALLWFLFRSRTLRRGWLCALLAFLGFANGLLPWTFRNYKTFHDVIPVADASYLHLWIGNNPRSTGGPQGDQTILETLALARGEDVTQLSQELGGLPQRERYEGLARDVARQIRNDPAGALKRRLEAGLCFVLGERWFKDRVLWRTNAAEAQEMPAWLGESYPALLYGSLLALLGLGVLGWRWSYGRRYTSMPASLAFIWVPLPYILSHAEELQGPRLPLDGVLGCYAAFALTCLLAPRFLHTSAELSGTSEERPR
jgi:4-amino-4-deoxy-L-arabinose transferase-like glycosyltransferase